MKLNKLSLKWKLFFFILAFSVVVIFVFCFFQMFLLDRFYRDNKMERVEKLVYNITETIDDVSFDELLQDNNEVNSKILSMANENEARVIFSSKVGENMITMKSRGISGSDRLSKYNEEEMNRFIMDVWKLSGSYQRNGKKFFVVLTDNPDEKFALQVLDTDKTSNNALICGQFIRNGSSVYLLLVDSRLTPVTPAVEAFRNQLVFITSIVVILTLISALMISKAISKPISNMNESAKKLATGNYDVTFKGEGFLEIAELNDTLNYAVEELKKTETLQRELLANVSHDLKTPLTLISGYAEMIRDIPSENNPENIQIIIDEANRLGVLVNDLLSLSKISSRTEPLNLSVYDINNNLINIVERFNKLLESKGFVVNYLDKGPIYVNADNRKIEQVIYNLINNAVNYSGDSRKIEVESKITDQKVRISVKDYGIGIKKDELEYIWDRYYRVDKGHQRSVQGSGLGLSIIKGILEYHGFEYGVESVENVGSTFYFIMPIINKK